MLASSLKNNIVMYNLRSIVFHLFVPHHFLGLGISCWKHACQVDDSLILNDIQWHGVWADWQKFNFLTRSGQHRYSRRWFQEEIFAILLLTRTCAGYGLKWQAGQLLTCLSSGHLHIFCQCNAWLQVLSNWRQRLLQASRQNIYKIGPYHKSGMSGSQVAGLSSHSMIWTF